MSRRSAMQSKRTELERKIKDLGSLPSEAFEKYRDHSLQELHKLLQKANTQLKKFRYRGKACHYTACSRVECKLASL